MLFLLVGRHAVGGVAASPIDWGSPDVVKQRLGGGGAWAALRAGFSYGAGFERRTCSEGDRDVVLAVVAYDGSA